MVLKLLDLPNELLAHICTFIASPLDRQRLVLVCRRFHQVVRQQSREYSVLNLVNFEPDKSPLVLFRDAEELPFSRLRLQYSERGSLAFARAFWTRFGAQIRELILVNSYLEDVLTEANEFFPNLRKLRVIGEQCDPWFGPDDAVLPKIHAPLEDLDLSEARYSTAAVERLLLACPHLRRLHLSSEISDYYEPPFAAKLPAWAGAADLLDFTADYCISAAGTQLKGPLAAAPVNGFRLRRLRISIYSEPLEALESFFAYPRVVDELLLFGSSSLTQKKLAALQRGALVRCLHLQNGLPDYEGALEALGGLRGLEEMWVEANEAFCWGYMGAETAAKIRVVVLEQVINTEIVVQRLRSLGALRTLKVRWDSPGLVADDFLQVVIQSCPELRELHIGASTISDAGLTGSGTAGWKPISKLKHLEVLCLGPTCGEITNAAFVKAVRLPKLTTFQLTAPKEFTIVGLRHLLKHSPNLQHVSLLNCSQIDDECIDLLTERLPYLSHVSIWSRLVTSRKLEQIQERFPHIKIHRRMR